MFDRVGSTSWHHRHAACFRELNAILLREGPSEPTVMIVGPGAVTRLAAPWLNDAAVKDASSLRKRIGDAARYFDQLFRRIPFLPLRSLEPVEVSSILTKPHRLIVIDRSRRVLRAVARDLPQAACVCMDITTQRIPVIADVVIAFNVVCRLEHGAAAGMANLLDAVRPGGLLLIDDRSAEAHLPTSAGFEKTAEKIHRLREAGASTE